MADDNRLVYATDVGRIAPEPAPALRPRGDGIVRIRRETSGRKGKGVCVITGVAGDEDVLNRLTSELKKKCGSGGSVKDGTIEIQGDKRDLIKQWLEAKGMKVKLAGG
ncbi:stress response translation initiation inhibitor YciH [Biostraticola tofi]|uniref:Uncharacterized protein YciH n=1 Tax=Biostraticola tofi TaxID=466109 RepID=A0A4R3Z281_9GAMM|nr:stress response translation initiation inhibitor YciH [Biostraticola tofi]TCV99883.1 translation initiation factor 1 [Biostraticola tofi]